MNPDPDYSAAYLVVRTKVKEFGAHHTVDLTQAENADGRVDLVRDMTDGGADVVIDLTGVQIRAAIRYPQTVLGRAIRFVADTPHFPWESLVDADFTLDEVDEALAQAAARKVTRAGIVIDD